MKKFFCDYCEKQITGVIITVGDVSIFSEETGKLEITGKEFCSPGCFHAFVFDQLTDAGVGDVH